MNLIVKIKYTNQINEYIENGARAFLLGVKGFSSFQTSELSIEELKKIKEDLPPDIELFVGIDKNIFNKELNNLKETLIELEKLNLSGIFFYDLAVLNIALNLGIKTPLIWNQSFLIVNYKSCNFYYERGVKGALISSEITIEEIKKIACETKMDIFVSIFGYQLMSVSKRKFISNYLNFLNTNKENKKYFLCKEDKRYPIYEDLNETKILSSYILNGLSKVNELKDSVKYLLLDEINIEHKLFIKVLNIYKKTVNNNLSNSEIENLDEKIKELVSNTSLGFFDTKTIYKVK